MISKWEVVSSYFFQPQIVDTSIFLYLSIKGRLSIFGYKYQMYHKKIFIMSSMLITILHDVSLHFLSIAIYSIMYILKGGED